MIFFPFFFSCQSANETMTGVCFVKIVYMCVHCAADRETLEEKPLILPTDSPVSALTLCILIWSPVTKSQQYGHL